MQSGRHLSSIRKNNQALLNQVELALARGDCSGAETLAREALQQWRQAGGPKEEESELIALLGKSLEGGRKYDQAYDLYMEALAYLTGHGYDLVYRRFLYLNERIGTFGGNMQQKVADDQAQRPEDGPTYPKGYYDDFNK